VYNTLAAGEPVQKIFRPSICQPAAVRVAVVEGRRRSCPASLMAADMTIPSRTIASSEAPNADARRSFPAATAICQRRVRFRTAVRCMFTPIATEASPRARRLDATSTSWTDSTPRPPRASEIGAVK